MTKKLYISKIVLFFICFSFISTFVFCSGKQDPQIIKEYFEIAQAYAEVDKYEKAIEYYEKASVDPSYKNAVKYSLARMYGLKNDWKKACSLLEEQYNEAPDNIMVNNAFAYALASVGEYERSCTMYKNVYEKDQKNPEAALNYARILIMSKKYNEATAFIEEIKTQFIEHEEKKVIDELEEKIKKALEKPKKEDESTKKKNKDVKKGDMSSKPKKK